MTTFPIQLNDGDLEKIDHLIHLGKYKNRSQAIKSMIQSKLAEEIIPVEWDSSENKEQRQQILNKIFNNKTMNIKITSKKNAEDLVREQRDYYGE
jgi:metal-responsive CopG/Arc/MetJ family transcriptional regulator